MSKIHNELIQTHLEELECMDECDRDVLISELLNNQAKIKSNEQLYYDENQDNSWIEHYYCNISTDKSAPTQLFQEFRDLIITTHKYKIPYYISKDQYLYTWVDLQPNGHLKSIYSGKQRNPSKVIEEDFETIEKLFESYRQLLKSPRLLNKEIEKQVINISRQHKFNTEHVVPQSWFKAKEPMKGDLHHLFACEHECNTVRSNFPFYEFHKGEHSILYTNHCGLFDTGRFEPKYGKGIVARAVLYFIMRYPRRIRRQFRKSINIDLLKRWHMEFPITEYEKHRNKAIFEIQGNRNPFIDFPDLIHKINILLE